MLQLGSQKMLELGRVLSENREPDSDLNPRPNFLIILGLKY